MKLAIHSRLFSSSPQWLPSYTLEEAIRRTADLGFDGIEIAACAPHAWPPYLSGNRRKQVRSILDDHGLEVSSVCPVLGGGPGLNPASCDELERTAAEAYFKECLDLAAEWECKVFIWVCGWVVYGTQRREAWKWNSEMLARCAEYESGTGVTLAIEPTGKDTDLVASIDDGLELMREINLPNVKVMFDTIHALHTGEVMADSIRKAGRDLVHVHISDKDRMPPGVRGGTDFRSVVEALNEVGYDGYLALEIGLWRNADPDGLARQGLEYMRGLLEACSGT
ncbi:MAG: sugar phosphate isomerase/epimerase family protein [Clostridia bacterium]